MSQNASRIARLVEEARQLKAHAYALTAQLGDKKLNDYGRELLNAKLRLTERQHVVVHQEIGRLRQEDERQLTLF